MADKFKDNSRKFTSTNKSGNVADSKTSGTASINASENVNDIDKATNNAADNVSDMEDCTVGYFIYDNPVFADNARKEQEKIAKLEKQINYNNPKLVYALYNKMLEGNYFNTPEGFLYLVHIQNFLYENAKILPGEIKPIPYKDEVGNLQKGYADERAKLLNKVRSLESEKAKAYKNLKIKNKRTDNLILKLIIGALILIIVVMIIITALSGGPTILNYRNQIQNEYSDWEQKLKEKEQELNERERALGINYSDEN